MLVFDAQRSVQNWWLEREFPQGIYSLMQGIASQPAAFLHCARPPPVIQGGRRHPGASPFRRCLAVLWWLQSIALATRRRASATDPPPKSFRLVGFTFRGVGGGKKDGKIARCVLEVHFGHFLQFFAVSLCLPSAKTL